MGVLIAPLILHIFQYIYEPEKACPHLVGRLDSVSEVAVKCRKMLFERIPQQPRGLFLYTHCSSAGTIEKAGTKLVS